MKRLILILALTAAMLAGQNTPPGQPDLPEDAPLRVIPVNNASAEQIAASLRGVMGSQAIITSTSEAVIVRGSEAVVGIVEQAVQQLDVAPPRSNVELNIQILYGSTDEADAGPIPDDLTSTVEQLQSLFSYSSYRLLDSLLLRGSDSRTTEISDALPSLDERTNQPVIYQLKFRPRVLGADSPRRILLEGLHFGARVPIATGSFEGQNGVNTQFQYINTGIDTDLEIREGQKTVVGKSSVGSSGAIILVVTPNTIE